MLPSNVTFLFRVPVFPECCARGRLPFPSAGLPRVSRPFWHSGKAIFPECNSSPSAILGEDWLPQVPDFWHSGKFASPVVTSSILATLIWSVHPFPWRSFPS
jgi:hypothetical protein